MKYYCLVIAIISTILWINMLFVEFINSKNQYENEEDKDINIKRGELRTSLAIIMGLFWSALIIYG